MDFFYNQVIHPNWVVWEAFGLKPSVVSYDVRAFYFQRIIAKWERSIMPAKNKASSNNWGNTQFAQIRLSEQNKVEFNEWRSKAKFDAALEIGVFIANGWKSSITWDDGNKCYIVASTCKNDRDVNHDICVTSRSDDFAEALLLNVYKVTQLYRGKKLPLESGDANWG